MVAKLVEIGGGNGVFAWNINVGRVFDGWNKFLVSDTPTPVVGVSLNRKELALLHCFRIGSVNVDSADRPVV